MKARMWLETGTESSHCPWQLETSKRGVEEGRK
jgi:hypothetical protein